MGLDKDEVVSFPRSFFFYSIYLFFIANRKIISVLSFVFRYISFIFSFFSMKSGRFFRAKFVSNPPKIEVDDKFWEKSGQNLHEVVIYNFWPIKVTFWTSNWKKHVKALKYFHVLQKLQKAF